MTVLYYCYVHTLSYSEDGKYSLIMLILHSVTPMFTSLYISIDPRKHGIAVFLFGVYLLTHDKMRAFKDPQPSTSTFTGLSPLMHFI